MVVKGQTAKEQNSPARIVCVYQGVCEKEWVRKQGSRRAERQGAAQRDECVCNNEWVRNHGSRRADRERAAPMVAHHALEADPCHLTTAITSQLDHTPDSVHCKRMQSAI